MNEPVLVLLIGLVACLYAMVGHGGASGYLALLAFAGASPEMMRPSALLLNLCVSALSFIHFHRAGFFRWSLFWPFAAASVPFAFIGGTIDLDGPIYLRLLALCLVVAALRLLGVFGQGNAADRRPSLPLALVIGAAIGLLSGMLGIGGGVLLSPVLLLCAWADAKQAAAISSLFIFVNSAAGLIGARSTVPHLDVSMLTWATAAIVGGALGGWLGASKAPEPRLRQALGAVLLVASIKLFWP